MSQPVLVPLRELLPHELIVEAHARRLALDILARGNVLRPLIVDAATGMIIDGHHRYSALVMLGAKLAPALLVDYHSQIAEPRAPTVRLAAGSLEEAIEAIESLASRGPHRILVTDGERIEKLYRDPVEAYHALRALEGPGTIVALPEPLPKEVPLRQAALQEPLPFKSTLHPTSLKRILAPVPLGRLL